MKQVYFYETKAGKIGVAEENGAITDIFFQSSSQPKEYQVHETALLKKTGRQLEEYFDRRRTDFDLPLNPKGTEFERTVWDALLTIPYGEVRSYKEIAEQIGKPKACRAVGRANGANPICILIPCHRVIGSNGALTGYGGGLEHKEYLLRVEGLLL